MVLRTSISFEKPEFGQEEAIRGHIDVDIDQYQAPADGHKDDYLCKFKVHGLFSFQQPDFRRSTLPKWKRGRDAIASWQSSIVDGTACEFTVNSKDCPFLLKPGSATRVRSIPFSFHMCRLGLPASFTSTRGRAKLEYIVSTTTTGRRARDTSSASFILLPYLAIRTFQTHQHNFNVDVENGGATTALAANVRNIITISYPARLLQGSLQNVTVTFPDDRFILQDVSMTVTSKLSVQAIKSSFAIEEDTEDIPCIITDDATTSKILSIRVPADLRESFSLVLKKSTVKKMEAFQLLFSYSVQISEDNVLYCTSSCEVPIVVVGVPPSELSTEINGVTDDPSTVSRDIPQVAEAPASDVIHPTKPISNGITHKTLQTNEIISNSLQLPDETVKQSAVKALRGILKKPKRRSKEDSKLLEVPKPVAPSASPEPSATSSLAGGVVPEISSKHSDDESPIDMEELGGLRSRAPVPASPEEKRASRGIQRGSLQLAAFDRTLFAIRGAELRNEYMRDSRRAAAEVEL